MKTNVITSVEITQGYSADNNMFSPLVTDTSRNFTIRDVCADKGYLSGDNYALVKDLGGQAFIPFKKNTSGKNAETNRSTFLKAFRYFQQNQEEFMRRYHKRSNIESTFSMIKRKFGNNVRCKKEVSQDNEIYAKVLTHNLCVLIQELFLNNINLNFSFHAKSYVARN